MPRPPRLLVPGATEEEALANTREAIREYLAVAKQLAGERELREVDIPAQLVCMPLRRLRRWVSALTDGRRIVTIPRHDPVDAVTMAGIVHDAGLPVDRFRDLL